MTQREEYLNKFWRSYPAVPEGICSLSQAGAGAEGRWLGGRIILLEAHGEIVRIGLEAQGTTRIWTAPRLMLEETGKAAANNQFKPLEILQLDDKVALREGEEGLRVILLAPALRNIGATPGASRGSVASGTLNPSLARRWQEFVSLVRAHWVDQGFIEVATPSLVALPGFEPTIDVFTVLPSETYLPTSPEIHLKKMLAAGWSEIFEIRSCFRQGEVSEHHQPEFTMLEWYRAYTPAVRLESDLRELLTNLERSGLVEGELGEFRRATVSELFRKLYDFDLLPETTAEELERLCRQCQLHSAPSDSWSDLFHRLWLERIDPWLAEQKDPILVRDFPPEQAALARINTEGWADRLELYWRGLEIANGFHELNDPHQQRVRGLKDLNERVRQGREALKMDESFISALESGMPPGVGMALGMERLFMAAQGVRTISELKAFPYRS